MIQLSPNLKSYIMNDVSNIRTSRPQIPEKALQGLKHDRLDMINTLRTDTLRTVMSKDLTCSLTVRQVQRDIRQT